MPKTQLQRGSAVRSNRIVLPQAFKFKKLPSSVDGYGNRRALICNGCKKVLTRCDPGNGAGFRYAHVMEQNAQKEHLLKCSKARRMVKALEKQMRQNAGDEAR